MAEWIIIIGTGMGGLAAGIYGQANGYKTRIYEMHTLPGGQCSSWKHGGFTFDGCLHHLFGCAPSSRIYGLWEELGAMPRDLVKPDGCVSVLSPEGRLFRDYYDLEKLETHLHELAPADSRTIKDYIRGIKAFTGPDVMGDLMLGSTIAKVKGIPALLAKFKWFKPTMRKFGERFSDPFLRRAFPLLVYSAPDAPLFIHLLRHAYGLNDSVQWPVGGTLRFALSIEKRYESLGGEIHYDSKVKKILVENHKAVGVKLADGTEHRADVVISNADGRKTIKDLLERKFVNEKIQSYCAEPPDETNWSAHVFLGVSRDLSSEPSALVMLLDEPVTIAGHKCESLEMQIYGFDKTMAPAGKGVIKVELVSSYSHWKELAADRQKYEDEKQRVAGQVIDILERHFPGIKNQVETVDSPHAAHLGAVHGRHARLRQFPEQKGHDLVWAERRRRRPDASRPGRLLFRRRLGQSGRVAVRKCAVGEKSYSSPVRGRRQEVSRTVRRLLIGK
jgi:phytoene dehydrogenase-like protein